MKHTTPAAEDYLKTIYAHTEWQANPITPSALADRLGVAPSSVTEMVKKLAAAGLIAHVPYGPLALTDAGAARASAVVRRHRLIETWLVREMGYDWDEVHAEAEILEHSVSDRLLEAMDARLGFPARDPHGDPIPAADGAVARPPSVLLADAVAGHTGSVLRISDRDGAILRNLAADGVGPGTELTVLEPLVVRVPDGRTLKLPPESAQSIWLTA
jgi:DtxR family Mn-dependent transcriptional regulator